MKYNSIGEQLIAKAKELDPNYKPDKFNDMSEAIDIILNNSGGKSVPPTLNLIDFENEGVRTTITEEEYNNLENGLYNQVIYDAEGNLIFALSPSKLFSMDGVYGFTQFKIFANENETFSYSSIVVNLIEIGEKNTSNEYPIAITEISDFTINPSSMQTTLNLMDLENGGVRTTITEEEYNNLENGLYNQVLYFTGNDLASIFSPSKIFGGGSNEYSFTQFKTVTNADKTYSYSSMLGYTITIGEKNTSNEYPITVTEEFTIDPSGTQIVDCTLNDQTDITKGGTVDNVPNAPFLLRIPLNLQDEGSYGKHLLDNILVPMNYTFGKFEQGGEGKVVPDRYFGTGFALSTFYYASVDISTKKVSITSQTNASYIQLPVDLPTESQPTVTISNPKQDIFMQPMLVGHDFWLNGVVLYGYLFTWVSPVYTKDVTVNNTTYYTMFYYTAGYDDVNDTFTIEYHEIPITTTITFEN